MLVGAYRVFLQLQIGLAALLGLTYGVSAVVAAVWTGSGTASYILPLLNTLFSALVITVTCYDGKWLSRHRHQLIAAYFLLNVGGGVRPESVK